MSVRQYEEERQERERKLKDENKRLRKALEEIETSSASDFDGIRQIARQALDGDPDE